MFEPELRSIAGIRQGNQAKSGLDIQQESYNALVIQANARDAELQSAADAAKSADASAAKLAAQQAQAERARALLAPAGGGPRPAPASASTPPRP